MLLKIKYRFTNDCYSEYRWWTEEMEQVGQFELASSIEEIERKARGLVVVRLELVEED